MTVNKVSVFLTKLRVIIKTPSEKIFDKFFCFYEKQRSVFMKSNLLS